MIAAPDLSTLGHAAKDALIMALIERLNVLEYDNIAAGGT